MAAADHLTVPRQHGLFLHHGIDLGDGSVAHYLEGREILRSNFNEFCLGQVANVVEHDKASPTGVTLRRAMSRIGEQRYNLLFNNCEHFANWCKTGRYSSAQMEKWIQTGSLGALAIGQLVPAALLTGLGLLLRKGLVDDQSRQLARQGLAKLEALRLRLLNKLESTLEQTEAWMRSGSRRNEHEARNQSLLLKGQSLADELAAVEDLEAKIAALLDEPHDLNNEVE